MSKDTSQKNYDKLKEQEEKLQFDSFTRSDALELGLMILEKAKKYTDPIAVEITVNGLVVFRHFTDGAMLDSEYWMKRKRNSVELMNMSSLRFKYWLELWGTNVAGRLLDPNEYASDEGGFPILLKGTGMIGSVCVSGIPTEWIDHELIVDSMSELLGL